MTPRILIALCALLLAAAGPVAAQEVQVPLDESGRVETADLALARRLGLWVEEYPGFREARLFRAADSTFVLEITTTERGRTSRRRVPLTAAEAAALRRDIGARIAERAPREGMDQRGRYLLLGQTALAGIGLYGWALPYALGLNDAGVAGTYLATAGASFFLPFRLTQNQPVSYGMATLSRYGVTRGTAHGLLLHNLLFERDDEPVFVPDTHCDVSGQCDYVGNEDDDRRRAAFALLGSVAEGIGGYLWARGEEMSAGTANTIALGGDAGLLWGLGAAYLLGADDIGTRSTAAVALPAAVAGMAAGRRLAARRSYTWGDADVLFTAGALGAYTSAVAVSLVDDDADRAMVATAILGGAAGLLLADRAVANSDFTAGQAILNRFGAVAGALAGASVGVLAQDGKVALGGSALGALIGYGVTYASLAPQAREPRGDALSSSLEVHLTPAALLGAAMRRSSDRPSPALPLLGVEYRFGAR